MTLTMEGLVFGGPGSTSLERRPVPVPDHDEVLVRIALAGICGTDRGIVLDEFPAKPGVILGHEAAGLVVAVGEGVADRTPGDRVVINPTSYCLECRFCRSGRTAHCSEKDGREIGVDCDGTMTEYLAVYQRYIHPLPTALTFKAATLVEPLACVLNNLRCADLGPDDRVVILGAGPIGTLCARVLIARKIPVSLVEPDTVRLRLARDILASGRGYDDVVVVRDLDDVDSANVVIDSTGVLLERAVDAVECGGTVVVMGEREGASASLRLRPLTTRGVSIRGAGPYKPADFEDALRLADSLALDELVTHVMPLGRYADAFALLCADTSVDAASRSYRAMKVMLSCDLDLARQ